MEGGLVVIWLLACAALSVAGWPIAATLFSHAPDRGAALALPIALCVLALVTFWIGHLSIAVGLAFALVSLFVAAALCARDLRERGENGEGNGDENRNGDENPNENGNEAERSAKGDEIGEIVVPAAEAAAVFVCAFSLLIAIRAVDPAVHPGGGEKFLDFGLLNSLLRATRLPPEDVWFAGDPVQYYYGGHLIASLLARLTGIDARYAYNLALATFYATLVTAVYGLAGALAADRGASRRAGGALGAFLVGLAGNLVTALYVLVQILPDSLARVLANAVAARSALTPETLLVSPDGYSYWTASRVVEGTVNEFPLFAWLNGDLHAHMMSTPFLVLVAALGYAYTRTPATDRRRRQWLVVGALPPVIGLLALVNTWSFPTAVGIAWLSLAVAPAHPATLFPSRIADRVVVFDGSIVAREGSRIGAALWCTLCVLVCALAWSAPFWVESASAGGRGIAFLPDRSTLTALLLVHGAFLVVFVPYLFDRVRPTLRDPFRAGVAGLVLFCLALATGVGALWLFAPLLVVAWLLARGRALLPAMSARSVDERAYRLVTSGGRDRQRPDHMGENDANGGRETGANGEGGVSNALGDVGYETVLVLAGLGLLVLVEFVYLNDGAGPGRYNTVFKTYMQVWILFAVAAGAIGARLLAPDPVGRRAGLGRRGAGVLVVIIVLVTAPYAGITLADHFTDSEMGGQNGPTIDALAFVSATHPDEAPAIRWLDTTTNGRQPTIVSAPGTDTYEWVNAPSSLTGVPTVAGWAHEVGYRGSAAYYDRVEDVDRIYTGTASERARLIREYDVAYVYVGPTERERYGADVSSRFEGVPGLRVAYRDDEVVIYAVDKSAIRRYSGVEGVRENPTRSFIGSHTGSYTGSFTGSFTGSYRDRTPPGGVRAGESGARSTRDRRPR